MTRPLLLALALLTALLAPPARAADVQSVSKIAFGPKDVLFVADWKQSTVHAVQLPASTAAAGKFFNIKDLDERLTKALGEKPAFYEGIAMRPGTGEAYVAVAYGPKRLSAVVMLDADGASTKLDLAALPSTALALKDPPKGDLKFWDEVPLRSLTVTDMKFHDGKLYVAGLSNTDFSSSLRVAEYPFSDKQVMVSVSIYHTTHDQIETRAPIRALTIADLGKEPYLIAAYTCTPLVTIPLAELKDGAKVKGKTVAELGFGNTPTGVLTYSQLKDNKATSYVLVTHDERAPDSIPLADIEAANRKAGMDKVVPFGEVAGLKPTVVPHAGSLRIDVQDDDRLIALRRNLKSGAAELVSFSKPLLLRRSDFIAEYNFPGYSYEANGQLKTRDRHEKSNVEEGFPKKTP